MSEPTSGGNQKPDPDQQSEPDQGQGENRELADDVFSDPTAPVWADPTAPTPAQPAPEATQASAQDTPASVPPAPPGGAYPTGGQQPPAATQPPPAAQPTSNPYAQLPPADPYGQPTGQYGQQAGQYGQPTGQYGQQQYPAYGTPYPTGTNTDSNVSAIILTIVSGLATVTTCVIGIPSLIFGIMALTSNSTDPIGSRRKAKTGWIVLAVNVGVVALIVIISVIALVALNWNSTSTNFDQNF